MIAIALAKQQTYTVHGHRLSFFKPVGAKHSGKYLLVQPTNYYRNASPLQIQNNRLCPCRV
ncbi:hypothetical protein ACE1CC_04140 [Aerosakkonemataceae cyanobacterium BLCC-F46]|uniref:Uncharacterized protein n=1 Tax=Floridaenema aerugineum BLCC-F46 TaxID=3153654 RepID=A0ABV4WZX4_9CYAN